MPVHMEQTSNNAHDLLDALNTVRLVLVRLDQLERKLNELRGNIRHAVYVSRLCDQAPRHDTLLDEETLAEIGNFYGQSHDLEKAQKELTASVNSVTKALKAVSGTFRGELKVKTEDRIRRHLEESFKLLITINEVKQGALVFPQQPFLIRQLFLSDLITYIPPVLDEITGLRQFCTKHEVKPAFLDDLHRIEAKLFSLKSIFARWRDNPSQRITRMLDEKADDIDRAFDMVGRIQVSWELTRQIPGKRWF